MDFICEKKNINKIFNKEVKIDYEKLSIMGHSFGGTTALYATYLDNRIKGVCVSYDPCIFGMYDKYSFSNIKKKDINE